MRTHVQKPSPTTRGKKASKYAFAPTEEQELVHERITTEKHKGKSANVFCRGLVRSEHVEFKAVPRICTRAYDIRFDSGGLSIRHFARLSRDERVDWLEAGGSNFDNLSATAEFSAASPASRIEDVVDSARVFLTYAREFCCAELVELVETIVKFIEHTLSQVSWTPKEISSLVFWVNDVLEDFRTAAEEGGELRAVQQRCTTEDRLLKDVMFIKVHRQVQDKRFGRIPKEVLRKLPVQNDLASGKSRRLCMRFLSAAGCAVDSDGGCPSEHGHFVPKQLPAIVKKEIDRRFGGLKDEYKEL
ncbi:hypothetical protein PHYSODRAFT_486316 [Phytophthora sojae]|uniref:Uncharacterized protein n=1 Tax=Phytophthora sojae (strain P6497) TaxID=1094619 RepID=G4YZQ1_PHYSP|nr:hypothetical protein PHYSODRAFT_486316 [Phytophthora sojae]EGZ25819.1 hypothetical protein PHYSODRAFT_486316 [Phytophthora sojae]|eukprot:XP_009521107.1 hypothetical protein PHYSODRAFT_486316 [Phytophthora sojae]